MNANLGIRQIREEIQAIINLAADNAQADGFHQDAAQMRKLTAHNIRHTGITHDININRRPLSHVQADAGHESIDTTCNLLCFKCLLTNYGIELNSKRYPIQNKTTPVRHKIQSGRRVRLSIACIQEWFSIGHPYFFQQILL